MKVYLVGGAVRDTLLGLDAKDKDWVVVGATDELMKEKGFIKVGKDFPVYLHPKTKEEYALARTERKTTQGYYGFETEFSPNITLEQDLARRDLTINSIAMDRSGNIIDPFNGTKDIKNRILLHTTAAFAEDPLRVIRLARLKTQLSEFGFSIHTETKKLVKKIILSGELKYIAKERLNIELTKALKNANLFFTTLNELECLNTIFPNINLDNLPSNKLYKQADYIKADKDSQTALVLGGQDINSITKIKKELSLNNQTLKEIKALGFINGCCNKNTSKEQTLENIKASNLLRDDTLLAKIQTIVDAFCIAYNINFERLEDILKTIEILKKTSYSDIIKSNTANIAITIKNAQLDIIKKHLKIC